MADIAIYVFTPIACCCVWGVCICCTGLCSAHVACTDILHEQNAAIGRANRFTLRWVQTLMTSFPSVDGVPRNDTHVVYTGLPVRREFSAMAGPQCKTRADY